MLRSTWIVVPIVSCCAVMRAQAPSRSIGNAFAPPAGFTRIAVDPGSFGAYLRSLPLRPVGSQVHLFNGALKARQDVHASVIDVSIGERDLQQCADAVMRLRAEYLFASGHADRIAFDLTNGFRADWAHWRKGGRIQVRGNVCTWVDKGRPDASHEQLLQFLEAVFTYAGSLSLQRELDRSSTAEFATTDVLGGDVFIHGGSPGHAMIVVDVAKDAQGRTAFLLAQSYMPAQEIHVVKNLLHTALGAWYIIGQDDQLRTPEWIFEWKERRRW